MCKIQVDSMQNGRYLTYTLSKKKRETESKKNFVKFALSACYLIQQTYINLLNDMQQVNWTHEDNKWIPIFKVYHKMAMRMQ